MAETVLLGYLAVSKDTVMVTRMKTDFFEKKVGVPGGAQDIPACTEAESLAFFDDTFPSTKSNIVFRTNLRSLIINLVRLLFSCPFQNFFG